MHINSFKKSAYILLRNFEKYTHTDMIYLTRGSFWLSLVNIVIIVNALVIGLAFANLLPQSVFGQYKYILSIFAILKIFSLPELNTAVTRAVAIGHEGTVLAGLKTKLSWGVIGSAIGIIFSIYYLTQNNAILAISVLLIALSVPFFDSFGLYNSYLNGKANFKKSSQYHIAIEIITTLILITALLLTDKLIFIVLAYALPYIIFRATFFFYVKRKFNLNKDVDKESLRYGKHLTVMSIFTQISAQIDKIIVWHSLGAIPLAIYTFGIALPDQIKIGINEIRILAFPKFANQDAAIVKKTLPRKILIAMLALIPVVIIYIITAPLIFEIFFPQYLESIFYSRIYAVSIILVPQSILLTYLESRAKKKQLYIYNLFIPFVKISLLLILIPPYGIIGAIASIMVVRTISLACLYYLFKTS